MIDRAADKMVRKADKKNGLRTLCIRPGMALVGAKDLFVASYFRSASPSSLRARTESIRSRAKNPIWGNDLVHHCQAGMDVALVEILAEKALLERPDECAGQGFLTTGDPNLYSFGELRRQIQVCFFILSRYMISDEVGTVPRFSRSGLSACHTSVNAVRRLYSQVHSGGALLRKIDVGHQALWSCTWLDEGDGDATTGAV